MDDLTPLPVAALDAMKTRLTNWLVGIVALDLLLVAALALLMFTKSPRVAMPLVPVLMIPAVALILVLKRLGAVKREMARRAVPPAGASPTVR